MVRLTARAVPGCLAFALCVPTLAARPTLIAEYSPGLSWSCAWGTKLFDDGRSTSSVQRPDSDRGCDPFSPGRARLHRKALDLGLTQEDVNVLLKRARDLDFFALSSSYSPFDVCPGLIVSDQDTLLLALRNSEGLHKVSVYGWRRILDPNPEGIHSWCQADQGPQDEIRRFLDLWADVLDKLGSPNEGQSGVQIREVLSNGQQR